MLIVTIIRQTNHQNKTYKYYQNVITSFNLYISSQSMKILSVFVSVPCEACVSRERVICGCVICPSSRKICCRGDTGTSGRPGPRSVCTSGVCLCSTCKQTPSHICRTWSPRQNLWKNTGECVWHGDQNKPGRQLMEVTGFNSDLQWEQPRCCPPWGLWGWVGYRGTACSSPRTTPAAPAPAWFPCRPHRRFDPGPAPRSGSAPLGSERTSPRTSSSLSPPCHPRSDSTGLSQTPGGRETGVRYGHISRKKISGKIKDPSGANIQTTLPPTSECCRHMFWSHWYWPVFPGKVQSASL